MKQKKWDKPQLIILERGRPEEAVLAVCKNSIDGNGPGGSNCVWTAGPDCDSPTPS